MKHTLVAALAVALCLATAAAAEAGTVPVTKSNGDFISGSGIPADDFTVATNARSGESVALKARGRDTGQPISLSGTTYTVLAGSDLSGNNPWWFFDWQFTPGTSATSSTNYGLKLEVDFDPTAGTSFVVLDFPVLGVWDTTDGFFTNPGGGAWSDDTVPYVYSQSWQLEYAFWGQSFDRDAPGTYQIRLSAYDLSTGEAYASTEITAQVVAVPLPPAAWLGLSLLGGLAGVGRLRRRRAQA